MSEQNHKMYWTYKTKYYVTTTIIPPSLPTPPTPPSTPKDNRTESASRPEKTRRGWYDNHVPSTWANRDPRLKRHYRPTTPSMHIQQPTPKSTGYFTAPQPSDFPHTNSFKRQRDLDPTTDNLYSTKKQKVPSVATSVIPSTSDATHDEKPTILNPPTSDNAVNVNDLFSRLVSSGLIHQPQKSNEHERQIKTEEVKLKTAEEKDFVHKVDLLDRESLKVKQPGLISRLYSGNQCSGCSTRFPPNESKQYSEHLDWHFRQNRRNHGSRRPPVSRPWFYSRSDWMQSEEVDDLETKQKSWFDMITDKNSSNSTPEEVPSVVAGALSNDTCAICGDKFDIFYNDDDDEWHHRNAVCQDSKNYHPSCLKHQKVSIKDDLKLDQFVGDESTLEKSLEVIEVIDDTEAIAENDVICIEEPVELVIVNDDEETDDETEAIRAQRDFDLAKVKQEPIESDDEPEITAEEPGLPPQQLFHSPVEAAWTSTVPSMDGNTDMGVVSSSSLPALPIPINISKPVHLPNNKEGTDRLKNDVETPRFIRQRPVQRGTEQSGLCSVM